MSEEQQKLDKQLFDISFVDDIESIDQEKVKNLIEAGANTNQIAGNEGITLLHMAVENGLLNSVKLLTEHGADICAEEENGKNIPLYLAIKNKHLGVIELLLECHDTQKKPPRNRWDYTPLHIAILEKDLDLAEFFLKRGANVNANSKKNESFYGTPLHFAINTVNLKAVELLLKYSADVNATDQLGNTPIHLATRTRLGLATLLFTSKANVNIQNECGDTPLHLAIKQGELDAATLLFRHDANADIKDSNGNTPLHLAIIALLIIIGIAHKKAESTARRKDLKIGIFFLALF